MSHKKTIFLIFLFLIFLGFSPALTPAQNSSESNNDIPGAYYKKYLRDYYYNEGKEFYAQGSYREAELKFRLALKCDPDYIPAATYLSIVRGKILQEQNLEEQKIIYRQEKKDQLSKEFFIQFYYKQGLHYFKTASYQQAIEKFKQALKWAPDFKPALKYLVLSEDKLRQDKLSEEKKILEEARKEEVKAKQELRDFYYKQGITYFKQSNFKEAISCFKQALEVDIQYKPAMKYKALAEEKLVQAQKRQQQAAKKEQAQKQKAGPQLNPVAENKLKEPVQGK